jgi:hypothetical protein
MMTPAFGVQDAGIVLGFDITLICSLPVRQCFKTILSDIAICFQLHEGLLSVIIPSQAHPIGFLSEPLLFRQHDGMFCAESRSGLFYPGTFVGSAPY